MTDRELASHAIAVKALEVAALEARDAATGPEHDMAQAVYRQAVAVRRQVGEWIVMRAMQAPRG